MFANASLRDPVRMPNYLYHIHDGHVLVHVEGRPCLLNTGAQFSVGYQPIRIGDRIFPVEACYLGITESCLSEHIGVPVEGMIGADILRDYHLSVYATEGIVQFNTASPAGDTVLPLTEFSGVPLINVWVNGRVRRLFLDTGSPTSLLLPAALDGLAPEGRIEAFYPLLGHSLTDIYSLDVVLGRHRRTMCFGRVPEAFRSLFACAGAQGLIGSELFRHFDLDLSLREGTWRLESPLGGLGVASA